MNLRASVNRAGKDGVAAPSLTSLARGAGCGCKLSPGVLLQALAAMPPAPDDDRILVGTDHLDDAAVVRVRDDLALVATMDFFTPPVDDPAAFGRIAAVNALSDVFAMGGTPVMALAAVAYPRDGDPAVLARILAAGAAAAGELGCPVLGGHSIDDPEPKYGLSVVGTVHPDRVLTNAAGRDGDLLLLTKPLGAGIAVTAARAGHREALEAAVGWMCTPNREASLAALDAGVACVTDVTGFGLLGHLREMAAASDLYAEVDADSVPAMPGVLALARDHAPGGAGRNRDFLDPVVAFAPGVPAEVATLLVDPQTSGGLLMAVPRGRRQALEAALAARGVPAAWIGRLATGPAGHIRVM